ncbi:hypothetical protein Afil01_39660 [Actinorhabdospora filicis]|uniref:N-acetyltransferase domain-containing protein n=1 Tax=Actinorhabdospora filicis TaxID=1785913 RepID=A0A9W6WA06_9ACTN|nr:GNAT family N-acetyltransferase [Actinorhabdospora filicis]GLZ79159.1 hypothetical protein Afil01_39660 [Actinorhabdospora filicis]
MRFADLTGADPLWDDVHREVLTPSFPPAELASPADLRAEVADGRTTGTAVLDARKRPVAAAIGRWYPAARVQLLTYLAVLDSQRGTGVGGQLLAHVVHDWIVRYRPCAILAEVEHPKAHAGSAAHGDPTARLRFYARHGGAALDLPYFQPALSAETGRLYGLVLLSLHVDPELTGLDGAGTVSGAALREFLRSYLDETEGRKCPPDEDTAALLAATDRPGGVPTFALDDPARLPLTTPPG